MARFKIHFNVFYLIPGRYTYQLWNEDLPMEKFSSATVETNNVNGNIHYTVVRPPLVKMSYGLSYIDTLLEIIKIFSL